MIKRGALLGPLLLAGLVFAACSSAAPPASGSAPTPFSAPIETPAVSGASRSATPTIAADASLAQLEGLEISNKGKVIRVFLPGLPEIVAEQVRLIPGVTQMEKYLGVLRPDYPNAFFGVEPGSELRVGDSPVSLVVGEGFQSREERAAIPGFSLNPFTDNNAMAGMAHRFSAGQSFLLNGTRLRVAGLFRASDKSRENAILLPLGTAQEIFDKPGELTDIFVTVDSEDNVPAVQAGIRNVLVEAFR